MAKAKYTPQQLPLAIEGATVEIPLSRGYVTVVDAVDADLARHTWHIVITRNDVSKYAVREIKLTPGRKGKARAERLHRVIMERILGTPLSPKMEVDHIDGNSLNNRRSNLRLATHQQNSRNRKLNKNSGTGFKGVSYRKDNHKWRAIIVVNQCNICLGQFDTPQEAHEAYCKAAEKYFGEFARFK